MTDTTGLSERLRDACIDWNGEPEVDGAEPVRIPTCGTLREAADALDAKDARIAELERRKLLATGDRELIEDSWRDDFWGWGPNRDGQNMLGKLWMEVRAALSALSSQKGG